MAHRGPAALWAAAAALCWWHRAALAEAAAPYTDSMTVVAAQPTVLPCGGNSANFESVAAVAWHRRPTGGSTAPVAGEGYRVRGDHSLLVQNVQPEDEGRFTCTDVDTDRLIAVYDLKVRKPSVVRLESSAADGPLAEGATFQLSCRVLTDSAAHAATLLVWRGERLIAPDDPRVTLTTQRARNVWRLSVANVTRADAGRYICRAKTYYDRAEAATELTVAPRVAADCTSSSAELRWSADAAAPAGFVVRMTVDGDLADEALVPGNMTSVEVSDLQAGSHVRFEVEAVEEGAVPGQATCSVPANNTRPSSDVNVLA